MVEHLRSIRNENVNQPARSGRDRLSKVPDLGRTSPNIKR
jgi:hypothetical protein